MYKTNDYRVVVGIDFGTTYSGFAYAHKHNQREIYSHSDWQDYNGRFKTPTALLYDNGYKNVQAWGFPALAERPSRKKKPSDKKPVELFKLHLLKLQNKPNLPKGYDYKKAITDYLREMGKVIRTTINGHWKVDFDTQVLMVVTVPAEFDDSAIMIMRECVYKAGLLKNQYGRNLTFTTEPEAAAIHCMKFLKEHSLMVGATFTVVDCGGGTVDLTTRELLEEDRLSEITVRKGENCGGCFVDQEFLKYLERRVGASAINLVKENYYGQLQYMVQEFIRRIKTRFTGNPSEFQPIELELDELCPALEQYTHGEFLDNMEMVEWSINLKFEDVKAMFDPVVEKILRLINNQLDLCDDNCSALFLVGGFSESKYLQSRVKKEFSKKVKIVTLPPQPVTAIMKGAVQYGLREEIVHTRVLKWSYGTDIARKWKPGDPEEKKREDGRIIAFERLAKRGTQVPVDFKVQSAFTACNSLQRRMGLDLYVTPQEDAKFCEDDSVEMLGKWSVELPDSNNEDDRSILYTMNFGTVEIEITAVNAGTGDKKETTIDLEL